MQYATADDFHNWNDGTATNQELRRASAVIDELTIGVVYERASNGPSEAEIADAFRDATCAQAAWLQETGDASGAGALLQGAQIGSVRLGGTSAQTDAMREANARRYSPEAVGILRTRGLLTRTVEYA